MATLLGSLLVSLGLESGEFKSGLTAAQKEMKRTQQQFAKVGKSMQQLGGKLSLGITAPFAVFAKTAFDGAIQAREAFAQVEQALATMGGASGKTADQLMAASKQLETFSNFDGDDILQKVTANLLTFGNVSGDVFDRAQQAAVDLSARLGQDLQSSAIQLGKSLNDPVKGVTALSRVGVSFTEDQKAMIKAMVEAGDVAGAQNLILNELEKQYGGAARAAREAAPGGDLLQAYREFEEVVGQRLVTAFEKIEQAVLPIINAFLGLDENTQTAIVAVAALAAAIGPALVVLGTMATGISALIALGPPLAAAFGVIKVASLALMTNPAILAFAGVLAGIYFAWKNWDKITAIVQRVYTGVKTWLQDKLGPIFDWVGGKIKAVTGFFKDMYVAVVGNSYVPDMVDGIAREMARLQVVMVDPALKATQSVEDAMRDMASRVHTLLSRLFPEIAEVARKAEDIDLIQGGVRAGVVASGTAGRAIGQILFGDIVPEMVKIDETLGKTAERVEVQTVAIADNFRDMSQRVVGALQGLTNSIRQGDFLGILGGVLDLFLQLGSTGLLGKNLASRINAPRVPGFANGTNFAPGGLAMVGERGPELVNLPRGSQVIPNRDLKGLGGTSTVQVIPSPYFDVVVDGRIAATAPAIAQGGAAIAQAQMAQSARRRVR